MNRLLSVIVVVLAAIPGVGFRGVAQSSIMSVLDSFSSGAAIAVTATRITNRSAPFIDGVLEDVWRSAGRVTFPNPDGGRFTLGEQHYDQVDPSTFTVYFLHDDINLYIAIETTNDSMVEGSDYDQNADGLAGMAIERKSGGQSMFRLLWHQERMEPCASVLTGPPLDRDRMVFDAEWRSALRGSRVKRCATLRQKPFYLCPAADL